MLRSWNVRWKQMFEKRKKRFFSPFLPMTRFIVSESESRSRTLAAVSIYADFFFNNIFFLLNLIVWSMQVSVFVPRKRIIKLTPVIKRCESMRLSAYIFNAQPSDGTTNEKRKTKNYPNIFIENEQLNTIEKRKS